MTVISNKGQNNSEWCGIYSATKADVNNTFLTQIIQSQNISGNLYYYNIQMLLRGIAWLLRLGRHRKHKQNERRRREALGGSGGMLPQKIFFRASETPLPMFFRGNLHKLKHKKC